MLETIHDVLSSSTYKIKFLYAFLIILVIAAFMMNFVSLPGFLQGKIIFTETIGMISTLFLLVFSLLAALAATLHVYKFEKYKTKNPGKGGIGIAGAILGIFTSACSLCYPFILTALGIPAALAVLPFGGAEVQALSIALLVLSIYFISKGIADCKECVAR